MVAEASDRAREAGVRDGMSAAEAKALCGPLVCIEWDGTGDGRALDALGRWMTRFTPVVARGWDDVPGSGGAESSAGADPPAALFLDLTGCERLFGGTAAIVRRVRQSLAGFRIPAHLAVAPTPGAAWAFAYAAAASVPASASAGGPADAAVVVVSDDDPAAFRRAIAPLPIDVLRLGESVVAGLRRVGVHRLGDLLSVPRDQLPVRFGPSLLARLDQLTGDRPEPLTRLVYDPPVTAAMEFDAPIESPEGIGSIFEKLLGLILSDLARRNHGVRRLRLTCHPDRGMGRAVVTRTVPLSRPHRDRATLLDLIRCEVERVDCEHGFVRFRLDVPLHEPVADAQVQLFDPRSADERAELDRLFQRLRSRLGAAAVVRPQLVESYLPERAWRPAADDDPVAAASRSAAAKTTVAAVASDVTAAASPPRPLTVFPTPVEVRVVCEPSDDRTGRPRQFAWQGAAHRLTHVVGPERVAGEWWRGHRRTRDYYDVEDDAGRRYWLFRVLHPRADGAVVARWFLHGRFD